MLTEDQKYAAQLVHKLVADQTLKLKSVKQRVSRESGVSLRDILGRSKKERISCLRQAIYFLYSERFGLPYIWIAQLTGRGDHTTILHGVEQMKSYMREYETQEGKNILAIKTQGTDVYAAKLAKKYVHARDITIDNLEERLCNDAGIPPEAIRCPSREARVALVRQVFYYVCSKRFDMPSTAIGVLVGRHHTTVLHGIEQVASYVEKLK